MAFDSHGNLWVANCDFATGHPTDAILEFTPAQLTAGGAQTPAVTISSNGVMQCPWSVAFDASGNVWVGDDNAHHMTSMALPTDVQRLTGADGHHWYELHDHVARHP